MKKMLIICILSVVLIAGIVLLHLYLNELSYGKLSDKEITFATIDVDGNTTFQWGNKAVFDSAYQCYTLIPLTNYLSWSHDEKTIPLERALRIANKATTETQGEWWIEEYFPIIYDFIDGKVYIVNYIVGQPDVCSEVAVVVVNKYTGTILYCGVQ